MKFETNRCAGQGKKSLKLKVQSSKLRSEECFYEPAEIKRKTADWIPCTGEHVKKEKKPRHSSCPDVQAGSDEAKYD